MVKRWVFGLTLVVSAGCGFPAAKVNEAKGHVQHALEVWQAGRKPDELKSQTPAVEFHEAMWNAGEKLVSFEMGSASHVASVDVVRCDVRLTLRNRKGKERVESVSYDVTLGPPVKVINNPMP